ISECTVVDEVQKDIKEICRPPKQSPPSPKTGRATSLKPFDSAASHSLVPLECPAAPSRRVPQCRRGSESKADTEPRGLELQAISSASQNGKPHRLPLDFARRLVAEARLGYEVSALSRESKLPASHSRGGSCIRAMSSGVRAWMIKEA